MTPESLIGLLAEPARMRVFAAVVLGARTPAEAARLAELPVRTVTAAVRRLTEGGLVSAVDGELSAQVGAFKDVLMEYARQKEPEPLDPDRLRAAVLRAFIVEGRLVSIPAAQGKRRVILEHVAQAFEPGVRYREREVNAVLRAWHPDYASLRRYLVDEALLAREAGEYWRIGGPVL
jgi:hypothetical protein